MTASSILDSLSEFRNRLIRDQDVINAATAESIRRGMPRGAIAETLQNLERNFQAIVQDPSIQLFVPFQLWKADYLAKTLPVVYEEAFQRFRWKDQKQDSVYLLAIVRIISDLVNQLEQYRLENEITPEPGEPGAPILTPPGTPTTPGTPTPPGTPPAPGTQKINPALIALGLGSIFLLSKI